MLKQLNIPFQQQSEVREDSPANKHQEQDVEMRVVDGIPKVTLINAHRFRCYDSG